MAASPLSVVLKGGWPNLDCLRLCTKAVKWVEWGKYIGMESEREAPQGSDIVYGQQSS